MAKRTQRGWVTGLVLCCGAALMVTGCKKAGPGAAGAAAQAPKVIAIPAVRETVAENLSLVGTLMANESVEVKSEADGVIREIAFVEGQRVEKGQLLARMDQEKLSSAVAEAEANFKLSSLNYERSKQLLRDKLISQQEYDQTATTFEFNRATLELKRRQLADTLVLAPFEGLVGARSVSPGQVITKNTTLTWLVDLDPIKVEINVPERFLSQLKTGQKVAFDVATYPGRKFEGEVYFVDSRVEEGTRTAIVKAVIPNPKGELLTGMFASLELTLKVREQAIVVPENALIMNGDTTAVFVVGPDQVAQIRPVTAGLRLAGKLEILKGLQEGELVIVEGVQKTIPGRPVRTGAAEPAGKQGTNTVAKGAGKA